MPGEDAFRDFFQEVTPIRLQEPLAGVLGAFEADGETLEFTFIDVVKAAGHACPTVTGAFLCCQAALKALYPDETPVRGDVAIKVYGKPAEGVFGVMAQVFTYITGAASESGFKGLGSRFRRQNLLEYDPEKIDAEATCFRFERLDTGRAVVVKFYPWFIPYPEEKAKQLAALMQPVVTGSANAEQRREFQDLWTEKIRGMVIERKEIEKWLRVEQA